MSRMLKSLFLTAATLAVLGAIGASAAQALPQWTVGGKALGASESREVVVSKITQNPTLEIPGIANIECSSVILDEAKIIGEKSGTVKSITLLGCVDEGFPSCEISDTVNNVVGQIHTNALTSELKTVGTQVFDYFTPEAGATEPYFTIVMKNCPTGGTFKVTGTVALLASTSEAEEQSLTASKALSETAGTALKFGTKAIFLKGMVDLKLAAGGKWSIDLPAQPLPPQWTVGGKALGASESREVVVSKITQNPTLEIPGIANIECSSVILDEAKIIGEKSGTVKSITLLGCVDEGFPSCEISDTVNNVVGQIHTNALTSELKTVGTQVFDYFTPEAGATEPYFTIVMKNCPTGGTFKVTGTVALLASTSEAEEQSLTASKALSETAGTALKFGTKAIFLKGMVDLKLAAGGKWSIDP
jgi:hypothetical protein